MRDMLIALMNSILAKDKVQTEACFRDLEKVGCDRYTAKVLVRELYKEERWK